MPRRAKEPCQAGKKDRSRRIDPLRHPVDPLEAFRIESGAFTFSVLVSGIVFGGILGFLVAALLR
jgi:hypothetical protein